ncbi:hypothetical protein SDC9_107818 [bioreactor metagenome]|uniref:Uncharacterized protein n=1 Tax=bioreactor metagenome TaxID=1076179 RepID=A0A645BGS7_9ZZZZ
MPENLFLPLGGILLVIEIEGRQNHELGDAKMGAEVSLDCRENHQADKVKPQLGCQKPGYFMIHGRSHLLLPSVCTDIIL